MSEWKTYKLGDLIDVQNGYAFKANDFSDKGIPVIKIKNIVSPRILFDECEYYEGNLDKRLEQFVIKKGDILISMTGSHVNQIASAVGKVGKYQFNYPALLNQRVGKLFTKNEELLNQDYFYYHISRFETQVDLASSAGGSANQANISPSQIKNLEITIPDLPTQTQIAQILTSLDDKIELNLQMNQTLEAMAKAIFKEWFVDFKFPGFDGEFVDGLPKGWRIDSISEIMYVQNGYAFKSTDFTDEGNNGILKIKNISNKVVDIVNMQFVSDEVALKIDNRFKVESGDLLIAMTGAEVGKVGVVPNTEKNLWLNQRVGSFKEKVKYSKWFCYLILSTNEYQNILLSSASGSAQPNISGSQIERTEIILPSVNLIEEFGSVVNSLFEKILENYSFNQSLIQTRDTLLPKLMSGKIQIKN